MARMRWFRLAFAVAVGLGAAVARSSPAGETAASPGGALAFRDEVAPDLVDVEFERWVDLREVQRGLRSLDRGVLAEQAERLARAERQVGRPHQAIPSAAVFQVLLRAAVEARDGECLDRVAKSLDELGQRDLLPVVDQARKFLAAPRKLELAADVPLSEVSAEAMVLYSSLKEQVRVARVVGDVAVLRELRQQLNASEDLHPKQLAYLVKLTDESIAALPAKPAPEQVALGRLAGFAVRGKSSPKPK